MEELIVLIMAFFLDILIGEPPPFIHPTVWFGKIVEFLDKKWRRRGYILDFTVGTVVTLIVISFAYMLALIIVNLPPIVKIVAESYFLFCSISIRSMVEHARKTIRDGYVVAEEVKKIVSRDVSKLDQYRLSSAVIESIAENFVDGVFAPLFYYTLFGIPGALVYRAINTCDAMIGYKNDKYIWFGKFSARLDDLANYIPARLSVLLFIMLDSRCISVIKRYRRIKLNGGYPISAMAGILQVTLEKPGHYTIKAGRLPKVKDIYRAIGIYWRLSTIALIIFAVVHLLKNFCECLDFCFILVNL